MAQSPATQPRHRVDRVQGSQEKDNGRARPGHRARRGQEEDKRSRGAAKRRTEFRGAAKRRTRGGQGPATEPSHRVDRVQRRGQEEDKAQPPVSLVGLAKEMRGAGLTNYVCRKHFINGWHDRRSQATN